MKGMLDLVEDETYYFDAEAAERPVRYIEKFCVHAEGSHAGKPFLLAPIQKRIVRDLYGWKRRDNHRRRFNEFYWEAAVGAGKSPFLSALGLYGLSGDQEKSAEVYSFANSYSQAAIVFDGAKKFIDSNEQLTAALKPLQYVIHHPKSRSTWRIVSKKGPGAGRKPSMALGDELHEMEKRVTYDALMSRFSKRDNPLMVLATNAGESRACFCWWVRERALKALRGDGEPQLYVVIWSAAVDDGEGDDSVRTDDEEAWKMANPMIGITIKIEKIREACQKAMLDDAEEVKFRRLYLGIWPKQLAGRWLDLTLWDRATAKWDEKKPDFAIECKPKRPLYVGGDLSQCDDLSAIVYAWPDPEFLYIDAQFWIPRKTAEHYHQKFSIPYFEWERDGWITIIPEPTISPKVLRGIANTVIARAKPCDLKAFCYDKHLADEAVATLMAARVICVPLQQSFGVKDGCFELDRRLKEGTIAIRPNPVLRFCAENATVKWDDRGNCYLIKPGANANAGNGYKGQREKKIDGISATVSALTEARKFQFPKPGFNMPATLKTRP